MTYTNVIIVQSLPHPTVSCFGALGTHVGMVSLHKDLYIHEYKRIWVYRFLWSQVCGGMSAGSYGVRYVVVCLQVPVGVDIVHKNAPRPPPPTT